MKTKLNGSNPTISAIKTFASATVPTYSPMKIREIGYASTMMAALAITEISEIVRRP